MKKAFPLLCIPVMLLCFFDGSVPAAEEGGRQFSERKVVDLVNRARLRGLPCGSRYMRATHPVIWNETLAEVSLKHSRDMADREDMGHSGRDGSRPGDRMKQAGYRWMTYGENVGEGYVTAEEAVGAWLKSPGHCMNIMNPGFKEAGASRARGAKGTYWTLVLAAPELSSHISP